jgi:uncharacterized DUF497 family protein
MDVNFTLDEIEFEWDSEKSASNFRKHGVRFETSCEVFFDQFIKVSDASTVEPRVAVIGMSFRWRLLLVVFVEFDESVRIVSARPADRAERELYENQ